MRSRECPHCGIFDSNDTFECIDQDETSYLIKCKECGYEWRNRREKYFIHKHEVGLCSGGPEEGGWWYDAGTPVEDWVPEGPFMNEDDAYARCRELNEEEHERAKREERYDYTSVLSYMSTHYSYSVHETTVMTGYPEVRPHYE